MKNDRPYVFGLCIACLLAHAVPRASSATALPDPAQLCDSAAIRVAAETGVPITILRALTRTETGRTDQQGLKPWPWTVNIEGHGVWFDSLDRAKAYTFKHFQDGKRNFDVGCFQINYRWHGHAFTSLDAMFDPHQNAAYAAKFLTELRKDFETWDQAVAAYHSRTPRHSKRYFAKFASIRDQLENKSAKLRPKGQQSMEGPLRNRNTQARSSGSLVRLKTKGSRLPMIRLDAP